MREPSAYLFSVLMNFPDSKEENKSIKLNMFFFSNTILRLGDVSKFTLLSLLRMGLYISVFMS